MCVLLPFSGREYNRGEEFRMKYKAAIIGCGNVGTDFNKNYNIRFASTHFEAYKRNKYVELVGVCDSDFKKAMKVAKTVEGCTPYKEIHNLLKEEVPEIVSIATPDETHYSVFLEVIKHQCVRAIWCEKPLSINMKESESMVKMCETRGIKLMVNHIRRYDRFYEAVKDNMKNLVGDVKHVTCYYSGGNVTVGSHLFDLLDYFFGDCSIVLNPESLLYKNGVFVTLVPSDQLKYPIMELNIFGTKGRLDTINLPFGKYEYRYFPLHKDKIAKVKYLGRVQAGAFPYNLKRDFFQSALMNLLDTFGKIKDPKSSGKVSLQSLAVISALEYSQSNKGVGVILPLKDKMFRISEQKGDVKKWK